MLMTTWEMFVWLIKAAVIIGLISMVWITLKAFMVYLKCKRKKDTN